MKARTALILTAGLVVGLASAGCSTETSTTASAGGGGQGRQCFSSRNVSSFAFVDDTTVNIRVGVNDFYRLTLFSPCLGGRFAFGVALQTRGASTFICSPLDAELIVPNPPTGPQRCPVSAIHRLTRAEVAALDPKLKP